MRRARTATEGSAWNETASSCGRAAETIGKALYAALRRESRKICEEEASRRGGGLRVLPKS
jgi:hypothetical protein